MKFITENDDGTINLTAPVMIPEAHDCDYTNGETPLSEEQIQEFAKSYEKYQFIDHEHGLTRNGEKIGTPIHSFLLTEDTTMNTLNGSKTYPSGTWMLTSQITNPTAIDTARNGGYTGYSASVFTRSRADEYLAALKSEPSTPMPCSCKDVSSSGNSLIKDVPDPVVLSVSLVKSPCLHDSEFCELNGDIMEDDVKSLKSKVLSAMGMTEEAEVEALKSEVADLHTLLEETKTEFHDALKSMKEEFTKTLTEALTPVDETAMKSEEEEEAEEPVEEEVEVEETEEPVEEEATEEPVAEKGESKVEPIHDNLEAQKSKPINIYEYMGKNPDGTRKH